MYRPAGLGDDHFGAELVKLFPQILALQSDLGIVDHAVVLGPDHGTRQRGRWVWVVDAMRDGRGQRQHLFGRITRGARVMWRVVHLGHGYHGARVTGAHCVSCGRGGRQTRWRWRRRRVLLLLTAGLLLHRGRRRATATAATAVVVVVVVGQQRADREVGGRRPGRRVRCVWRTLAAGHRGRGLRGVRCPTG